MTLVAVQVVFGTVIDLQQVVAVGAERLVVGVERHVVAVGVERLVATARLHWDVEPENMSETGGFAGAGADADKAAGRLGKRKIAVGVGGTAFGFAVGASL